MPKKPFYYHKLMYKEALLEKFHEAPLYFHEAPHPHLYKKGECVKEAIIKNPKSYMELHKLMEEK